MQKVTARKILNTAKKLKKDGKKWHFHFLNPGCVFNTEERFALILESPEIGNIVNYRVRKPAKAGKVLVQLLHGKGISKKIQQVGNAKKLPPKVKMMVKRAIELNKKGFAWHHHLLFPDCMFNEDRIYWTLIFEDPINKKVLKYRSKTEPKKELQQIEPLFYTQKK